jgi:hypothetical protein
MEVVDVTVVIQLDHVARLGISRTDLGALFLVVGEVAAA